MNVKKNISIININLTSGGAEKVISLLLTKLVQDFKVTLFLLYNDIHFDIPKEVDIVIFNSQSTSKKSGFIKRMLSPITFQIKFFKELRLRKISVSISFLAFPNFLNSIASLRFSKLKTVISERGYPSDNTTSKLSFYVSKIFYPILYNRNDVLFSNSVYINEDLKDNFGVKIPMKVIYNPIEIPVKTILPNSLGYETRSLDIITAGSLITRKNQIMIIRAIENSNGNHKLTILGDGPLEDFLKNEITINKLQDQVFLKGKVKNVNEYLLKSNCFVLSSFTEGFPNALLEAMAIGLPCISTNCLSGPLELLHDDKDVTIKKGEFFMGSYGILINNDDHEGLKKALDFFHNHPKERKKYSELSLKRSEKYHLSCIYEQFKEFINN